MFQTFSGSSKRARQVNLSGQNANPFAAAGWGGSVSGTRNPVANAQQERQQRQQERDRLNAAKRIQRTWRGHRAREELSNFRRKVWDEADGKLETSPISGELVAEQVQLIVAFFNRRHKDDIERLVALSRRISTFHYEKFLSLPQIQTHLLRLARITLDALHRYESRPNHMELKLTRSSSLPSFSPDLLQLLVVLIDGNPRCFQAMSQSYYTFLSRLCTQQKSAEIDRDVFISAIRTPLIQHVDPGNSKSAHSIIYF
jgi:ubiquitin-protein ligase E3 C